MLFGSKTGTNQGTWRCDKEFEFSSKWNEKLIKGFKQEIYMIIFLYLYIFKIFEADTHFLLDASGQCFWWKQLEKLNKAQLQIHTHLLKGITELLRQPGV